MGQADRSMAVLEPMLEVWIASEFNGSGRSGRGNPCRRGSWPNQAITSAQELAFGD